MKRSFPLCIVALAAAACAENSSMIEIDGRLPPDPASCVFAPSDVYQMGPGTLDIAAAAQPNYRLALVLRNNIPDPKQQVPEALTSAKVWRAFAAKVRVNPSDYVKSYAPNPSLLAIQTENTTPLDGAALQPAGGKSVQLVEAISGPLGSKLAGLVAAGETRRVVLGITLRGQTADGAYLDTGEWYFPLDVCSGCLAVPVCASGATPLESNCFAAWQDSAPACPATTP